MFRMIVRLLGCQTRVSHHTICMHAKRKGAETRQEHLAVQRLPNWSWACRCLCYNRLDHSRREDWSSCLARIMLTVVVETLQEHKIYHRTNSEPGRRSSLLLLLVPLAQIYHHDTHPKLSPLQSHAANHSNDHFGNHMHPRRRR